MAVPANVNVRLTVIDAVARHPIGGAEISIESAAGGGPVTNVTADVLGQVNPVLEDQSTYLVTVSRAGYRQIKVQVVVDVGASAVSPNVLGMYPTPTTTLVNKQFGFVVKDNTDAPIDGALIRFYAAANRVDAPDIRLLTVARILFNELMGGDVGIVAPGYNAGPDRESDRHLIVISNNRSGSGNVVLFLQHDTPNTTYFITLHHVREDF